MKAPRIDFDGRVLVRSHGLHQPRRIVIHDTESHDAKGIRDLAGIATYWNGISWGPGAHVGVDVEAYSARYVDDGEIAYHTQGRNTGSLGIEIVGFARFAPSVWLLRRKQLEEVAWWLAFWSTRYGIPLRVDVDHGVSTHRMQSKAYGGSHWDPGFGFPLGLVLRRAKQLAAAPASQPRPKPRYQEKLYWLWLRWRLGEGEFKQFGPANETVRPRALPDRVPDEWRKRAGAFLARRAAASSRSADV